jgi:hypothetical protein
MTAIKPATRREIRTQISFALYGAANRMARLHKPLLEPLGLTLPQYLVMLELFGGTPRAVGELGAKLGMDTGRWLSVLSYELADFLPAARC